MSNNPETDSLRPQIGLGRALFQSIAFMGPGASIAFSLGLVIANAGIVAPLAVVVALVAALCVAASIGQLARHIPASGGFFSYATAGLGKRWGFMTGWLWVQFVVNSTVFGVLLFGYLGSPFCNTYLHVNVPWWVLSGLLLAFAGWAAFRGVKFSTGVTMVLGTIEVVILLIVIIALIAHAGSVNTLSAFNPAKAPSLSLFALGVVYCMSLFIGFEGATPLAEEVRNPRRNIALAVVGATFFIGLFYIIATYAGVVSWGPSHLSSYINAANPWVEMASKLGSWVAFFVALAILNSLVAFVQAVFNGGARLLFAMGRAEVLPNGLSKLHPRHRTPYVAVEVILVLSAVVAYVLGFWRGVYAGLAITVTFGAVCFILIYIIGCAANFGFFLRRRRAEFSIFWNTIVPLIGIVVLAVALYKSIIPLPAYPGNYGVLAAYVWIFLGLVGVVWRGNRLSGDEFARAMQLADDSPESLTEPPSEG